MRPIVLNQYCNTTLQHLSGDKWNLLRGTPDTRGTLQYTYGRSNQKNNRHGRKELLRMFRVVKRAGELLPATGLVQKRLGEKSHKYSPSVC